ncbi:Uridine monophosphate kinase [hydrothermal vent metagenome]|uniref:Uridylate kinase n=1 Tax=hydrothermal vent metagenome TaxID=652676 RepID=A0A3B0S4X3_9ZZZZ
MGDGDFGIDIPTVDRIAGEIAEAQVAGAEIGLVIGGGNIFRGVAGAASGMDRGQADYMGMLATVMNALAMHGALTKAGVEARVMSALSMPQVCEPFSRGRALKHLDKGRVVLFAAGTGSPFFTTDTGAALKACEMKCEAFLKGTSVDGIYSGDPKTDKNATRYDEISYSQVLANNLRVMDAAAITLARDADIPVIVFSIQTPGALLDVLKGQGRSTKVTA